MALAKRTADLKVVEELRLRELVEVQGVDAVELAVVDDKACPSLELLLASHKVRLDTATIRLTIWVISLLELT